MLNISPFTYGMVVLQVYDSGNVFAPAILDIEENALLGFFTAAIRNVASVSLAIGYPTIVSVSHSLVNSYKNLLAISVETEYEFEGSEKVIHPLSYIPWMISTAFFPTCGNGEEKVTLIFY
jgi:large subunit ribosomal protein LP0